MMTNNLAKRKSAAPIKRFSKAIVRRPGKNMIEGLRSSDLGLPDYDLALKQHDNYIEALRICGLDTIVLEADERFPDSVFVEDTALLTPSCAIITRPGAETRRGEEVEIKKVLAGYYEKIYEVTAPGTVEAGDIMMIGSHFFIGISERTNRTGAEQVMAFLEKYGMTGSTVELEKVLHLKTGVSYLEYNNLTACGEFIINREFSRYNLIEVDSTESYAANCIWVNDIVIVPEDYPLTRKKIDTAGYETLAVDLSEFRKLDGGLSCLSLRF